MVEEDIQRLRAMEQPNKLITQANLELKRQSGSTARLRASSPMDQNAPPLIDFASPGSEISTVPHPNSHDHPSTLLTNSSTRGFSSLSSPNFTTTAEASSSSRSWRLQKSSTTEMTPLGTIPEQSYSEMEFSKPAPTAAVPTANQHTATIPQNIVRAGKTLFLSELIISIADGVTLGILKIR